MYVSLATWLVLLVPALALTSPVGGPAVLYLAGLVALTALAVNAIKRYEPMAFGELWPMSLVLLLPLACMFITSAVRGVWSNSELEKLLRFALALPVLWLLLRAPQRWLKLVQWSILAGAIAGSVLLIVTMETQGRGAMVDVGGRYNAVAFANMTLLFGAMTLLSLGFGPCTRWPRAETTVKLVAVALSVYATWESETRSSWMLLPILGVVFLLGLRNWKRRHKVYCALAVCVALVASAAAIWKRVRARFEPMEPATILAATEDDLRACGLSAPKIRTMRAVAQAIHSGEVPLADLPGLPADEAHAHLVTMKGIGPWTTDIYLLFCIGHPDAFPAGDLALQEAVKLGFGLDERPSAKALAEFAERWRPWRGAAAKLLWAYYSAMKRGSDATPLAVDRNI